MDSIDLKKTSKEDQRTAKKSYDALAATLEQLHSRHPQIKIEGTEERIRIPKAALKMLAGILNEISKGNQVSVVPVAREMTTQAAAGLLGCSRPHLVKLLEEGHIRYTKVGKHRRIRYEDLIDYKKTLKANQRSALRDMMQLDEESGLYDS